MYPVKVVKQNKIRGMIKGEINLISRNQLSKTKLAFKPKSLGQNHNFF